MLLINCFKPYYKWITFNTQNIKKVADYMDTVLNLIINGLPSILYGECQNPAIADVFKF